MQLGVVERFGERVPEDLLCALVTCIRQGNCDAAIRLREAVVSGRYSVHEARDVFAHERRAHVETRLQTLPQDFAGLLVESHVNRVGNCHKVVRLPGALLTVCYVQDPRRMVRPNKHRRLYASSATGNLDLRQSFFTIDTCNRFVVGTHDVSLLEKGHMYGVVFYSAAEDNSLGIGHIGVGFPNSRFTEYVAQISLTEFAPNTVAPTAVVQVEDRANVEMLLGEPDRDVVPGPSMDGGT